MSEPILNFQHVFYSYESEEDFRKYAVKDVSLQVHRGEIVAVLGHNGSGKSTFAKLSNAIFTPDKGEVLVDGISTSDESKVFDIRSKVGMVFQNPDNQIVATIVEDDVAFGCENLGLPPKEIRQRVDEALQNVGMYEFRHSEPHRLSGGQKQRVAIAGVLAMHTDCIVLDEATAMLDPGGRKEVMDTVLRLNKEQGMTVLFITHYMDEAVLADRVLVLNEGETLMEGTPAQVFAQGDQLREIGLDLPHSAELAALLREAGVPLPQDILTADACADALYELLKDKNLPAMSQAPSAPAPAESENPVIHCKDLTHTYKSGAVTSHAVKQVNLQVEQGELVAVIGHTGSGKSTLIQHFNGLLKPTSGEIFVDGENIWQDKLSVRRARFKVGLCFQYPEAQLFEETVYKDIAFGPKNMGLDADEIDRRIRTCSEFVGLDAENFEKSPFELSGGQKRRVAIAGVMAMEPEVLVMDEPTAGLDPHGRDLILGMIADYRKNTGRTVLLVSHSMEDVARLATKVLVMEQGTAKMYGTVDEVYAHGEELLAMGLNVPQVTMIFHKLQQKGLPVRANVYTPRQGRDEILRLLKGGEGAW